MKYELPTLPKEVAEIVEYHQFIAFKQSADEATILWWILDDIQESSEYTSASHWIENNIAELAIAIQFNRFNISK
jgi:hypothetical protein